MKKKLGQLILLSLTIIGVGVTKANDNVVNAKEKVINTEFVSVSPYLGSIRDVYPGAVIQTFNTDYFSFTETVDGGGFSKGMEYLLTTQQKKLLSVCQKHKGEFKQVFYGFDNISVSERQLTDISVNQLGNKDYKTGQKVHYLFNMYCATIE